MSIIKIITIKTIIIIIIIIKIIVIIINDQPVLQSPYREEQPHWLLHQELALPFQISVAKTKMMITIFIMVNGDENDYYTGIKIMMMNNEDDSIGLIRGKCEKK